MWHPPICGEEKAELESEALKLAVPTLTCGYELWVVTKRVQPFRDRVSSLQPVEVLQESDILWIKYSGHVQLESTEHAQKAMEE